MDNGGKEDRKIYRDGEWRKRIRQRGEEQVIRTEKSEKGERLSKKEWRIANGYEAGGR